MIVLLQRVSEAKVDVSGQCIASIGPGILALIGVQIGDNQDIAEQFISRIIN